jgi:O-antigen/teichoic acid export membrane protein
LVGRGRDLYTATAGLAALYGLKFAPIPERSLRNGLTLMKSRRMRFLRAAMPIQIANMANYLSDWAIVWLLMLTASLPDVAAYRVISQIGTLFMLLSIGIEVPYSTAIAGAHASGTQDLVRRLFRQSRILLLLMGLPLIVALIIFPGELLALFEVRSASAHYALLLVTAGHAFRLSAGASASSLVVLNGHRALVRSSLLALAISAVLALCLAPWFGLIGAALASGLGMTARSWLNLLATKRIIASPFR